MLKGAIIGFGKIAQSNHITAFETDELKNEIRIIAVVEKDDNNRKLSREKYPHLKFYKDIDSLFRNENIDFIDITVPPNVHYEILKKGIEYKVHIMCEKPFTRKLSEADKIKLMLENSDICFMPCHQYKYLPLWQRFKKFIDDNSGHKVIAKFEIVRTEADCGLQILGNRWRINKEVSGGGITSDTGVHYLYLCNWLLGNPINITSRMFNLTHHDYNVEDTTIILGEFEKGIAEVMLTWAGNKRFNSASITSSSGAVQYSGGSEAIIHTMEGEEKISIPDPSSKESYTMLYVKTIRDFIFQINSNKPHKYLPEAYNSIKLLSKCYESAETKTSIGW